MKKIRNFWVWLMILGFFPISLITAPTKTYASPIGDKPTVGFVEKAASNLEPLTDYKIEVALSEEVTTDTVTVDYRVTANGTATIIDDFQLTDGTLEFEPGEPLQQEIPLKILNDELFEKDETIEIELFNPSDGAKIGENSVFTYTIIDDDTALDATPDLPDGQNGWFVTHPSITLIPPVDRQIFYRWNNDGWNLYDTTFFAPQGENKLYYYSVDDEGNEEKEKSTFFRVDTIRPAKPTLTGFVGDDGFVHLSWPKQANAHYKIWQGTNVYKITGNSFIDASVIVGQSYTYKIQAIDQAGNKSATASLTLQIPNLPEPEIDEPVETPVHPQINHVVKPAISGRISVNQSVSAANTAAPEPEVSKEKVEETGQGIVSIDDDESIPADGRNRLLVAISILVIAAGAAIAGYYGYEWWINRRQESSEKKSKKNNSRW